MDIRARLLDAATKVFAETGYRGATTRRIADEAGVNEVTLFRHFGSKDSLIHEALRCASSREQVALPDTPVDPEPELVAWCIERFRRTYESRTLIRKVLGEIAEHPEISRVVTKGPGAHYCALHEYVARLIAHGMASGDVDVAAASNMLVGTLFAEAMSRDIMPEMYRPSPEEAIAGYVRVFLRAIGTPTSSTVTGAPARG